MDQTVLPPKYTLPALQRLFKNSPYNNFVKNYPSSLTSLRAFVTKEKDFLNQVSRLNSPK